MYKRQAISKAVKIPMDCHLMVTDPDDYIESLAQAGAGYILSLIHIYCPMPGFLQKALCTIRWNH